MKRKLAFFVVVILILAGFNTMVLADSPAPGGPFSSAFNIQNLTADPVTCAVTYYDANGVQAASSDQLPTAIAGNDKAFVYVPSEGSLSTGAYSAVVSCDGQVAVVSNFSDSGGSTAFSGASFSGVSDTDAKYKWYTPNVYDNYYNFYTNIVVQNAGSSATDVTVSVYAPGSSTAVHTLTKTGLAANASYTFEMEGLAQLDTGKAYSAVIEGANTTDKLAVITNIYGRGPYADQLYSFNAFSDGATTLYAPVIMNDYYGYNTDFTIQNIGTAPANVTVTYYYMQNSSVQTKTQSLTIPQNSAQPNYTPAVSGVPSTGNLVVTAKAVSTNGEPIIGVINESNGYNRAASYSAFTAGSTNVRAPIVYKRFYGFNTSITCMNVGSSPASFTAAYVADSASGTSAVNESSTTIDPNFGSQLYQPNNSSLNDGYNGAAAITSSQPMACVVNEDITEGATATTSQDSLFTYNGINSN